MKVTTSQQIQIVTQQHMWYVCVYICVYVISHTVPGEPDDSCLLLKSCHPVNWDFQWDVTG
jgi:hypothetical protein